MFDQLKNMAGLLGQAREMRSKMEQVQKELASKAVEAEAGSGAVRVVINGKLQVQAVHINPAMLASLTAGDADANQRMVEDLVRQAFNDALEKAQALIQQEMAKVTGDMDLGAMGKLLGQ